MRYRLYLVAISLLLPASLSAQELDAYRQFDTIQPHDYQYAVALQPASNAETDHLNAFVDTEYSAYYSIGAAQNYSEWGNYSDTADAQRLAYAQELLSRLRSEHSYSDLDDEGKLTYLVFEAFAQNQIRLMQNAANSYPITHRAGVHTSLVNVLVNYHTIQYDGEAQVYIARTQDISRVFDETISAMRSRADNGVILPSFLIPMIIANCQEMISGRPFNGAGNCPVMEDFLGKINGAAGMTPAQKNARISEMETVLLTSFGPAYERLIAYLQVELLPLADEDAGVWKLPNGDTYYQEMLKYYTTTNMSPKKIHRRGLRNVRRIHREMIKIMEQVNFKSDELSEFFIHMRTKRKFYLPNTSTGKEKFIDRVQKIVETMQENLDEMFVRTPRTPLLVRAIEPYREKTAGIAFYTRPSTDLSRPGVYYINTYDLRNIPLFELESLSHHEGLPGHHFQIALTLERDFDTTFRKLVGFTGYIEGWALYAEAFPKEFGFYDDPYSDFGRLSEELWRACRLVVDTGLHDKQWTREEAIDYLLENTPSSEGACRDAIDRYIVMPGQACAYMIGKQVIEKLRSKSEKQLGKEFDLREFHEAILQHGALPLWQLQEEIERWISMHKDDAELDEAA